MRLIILLFFLVFSSIISGMEVVNSPSDGWVNIDIPDTVFQRMKNKSFPVECKLDISELRYLKVLYWGTDDKTHEGEIVCNKSISTDLIDIFQNLYEAKYRFGSIRLIDDFYDDVKYTDYSMNTKEGAKNRTRVDNLSMEANNTSCFNFRYVTGTNKVSKHGIGMAIDINPLYNPYYRLRDGYVEPTASKKYVSNRDKRTDIPMKIDKNDLCYKLFISHGFKWGGAWKSSKDYQHFEK